LFSWFGLPSRRAARLFQSRFAAYWSARRARVCHEDALLSVANSRRLVDEALAHTNRAPTRSEQEAAELKALVWLIFCHESGQPPTADAQRKMTLLMEECFARVEVRARLASIGQKAEG